MQSAREKNAIVHDLRPSSRDERTRTVSESKKLRVAPVQPAFHVVLVEPEIPPNTGSIARTCAATCSPLHLVGKLGFRIDEQSVRRAGLDYWHLVDLHRHESFEAFENAVDASRLHLFSANATRSFTEADFRPGDSLVFGKESVGLPEELTQKYESRVWGIPTSGGVRSLNLSNAVSIVLFDAIRRNGGLDRPFVA